MHKLPVDVQAAMRLPSELQSTSKIPPPLGLLTVFFKEPSSKDHMRKVSSSEPETK